MLLGTYEKAGVPWSPTQTPWDFGQGPVGQRTSKESRPSLEVAFRNIFPALGDAGIRKVCEWTIHVLRRTATPLVGPVKGLKNFWVACGVHGRIQPGVAGWVWALSRWLIDGDPGADIWGHGTFARATAIGPRWRIPMPKFAKNYSRRFSIRFPKRGTSGRQAAAHGHRFMKRPAGCKTPCSATTAVWSIPCGSRPERAERQGRVSAFTARMTFRILPPSAMR